MKISRPGEADSCSSCNKELESESRALFVEEEVGRIFCSENCIVSSFNEEIQKLEEEYFSNLSSKDLDPKSREKFAHLRWKTLENPAEVWREKQDSGDQYYFLISEFKENKKPVYAVAITLFLRGEPSFLFLSFVSNDEDLVQRYRKGERVEYMDAQPVAVRDVGEMQKEDPRFDSLAASWTAAESFHAELSQHRSEDDIPPEEFSFYDECLEETLEEPDELWTIKTSEGQGVPFLYHFIREYENEGKTHWFVVVAREMEDEEHIEVIDAFPSRDPDFVEKYRIGSLDYEGKESEDTSPKRMVH